MIVKHCLIRLILFPVNISDLTYSVEGDDIAETLAGQHSGYKLPDWPVLSSLRISGALSGVWTCCDSVDIRCYQWLNTLTPVIPTYLLVSDENLSKWETFLANLWLKCYDRYMREYKVRGQHEDHSEQDHPGHLDGLLPLSSSLGGTR